MVCTFPMLAEVADKELSVPTLWLVVAVLAAASFLLCRWRRWAALIAFPLVAIWLWLLLSEIHDRFVGPAIVRELGRGHVAQTYLAAFLPLVFLALGLAWRRRHPSNHAMERTPDRSVSTF
jgi:hypothetical protein